MGKGGAGVKKRGFSFFEKPPDRRRRREIEAYLKTAYPALAREEIGKSCLGEPLTAYRFGEGKQALLYVGAHHGMEWITALLLYRFVGDLCLAHARRGMGDLFASKSLYVLPILNPDGVDISLRSEKEGGKLVSGTIKFLVKESRYDQLLPFMYQCGCKYLGYRMGKAYKKLPMSVVKKCSMNRNYWK